MPNNDDAKKAAEAAKKAAETKKAVEAAKKAAAAKKLPDRTKPQASASGSKPVARSTKLGAFQPLRGTFNATTGKDEWNPYQPNTREFILLADAYNLGLRLLERPDATAKLVDLGRRCVKEWKSTADQSGYHWSGDDSKMTEYVNHFLEKYRNQCTRLDVSARPLGDAYAETVFDVGYVLPDHFRLDPKALTHVFLDKELFGEVVQNDAKRAELFATGAQKKFKDMGAFAKARKECADLGVVHQALLGAIIFHEFAHCFVFYLGMNGRLNTPPGVSGLARQINEENGESGAWLEKQVLGGTLVIQDNVLYLVDKHGQGREVDMARMKEFVNKPEAFDLKTGLPLKSNGRVCATEDTQRSPAPSPDTRQRAVFQLSKAHKTAYDVYLGKDENGVAIHTSSPSAVAVAA